MIFRFGHFLILFTISTSTLLTLVITRVVQTALREPHHFSSQVLQTGAYDEVIDFITQVPMKKLAFILLAHNPSHVFILLLFLINCTLVFGYFLQRVLFARLTTNELSVTRKVILQYIVFRLIFLGSILENGVRYDLARAQQSIQDEPTQLAAAAAASTSIDAAAFMTSPVPGASSTIRELSLWLLWFTLLGFLRYFLTLLRERFLTAQASPHATIHTFMKYFIMTCVFSLINILLGLLTYYILRFASSTIQLLILFETIVLISSCVKILYKYALYIKSLRANQNWEEYSGSGIYYIETMNELIVQCITLAHLMHIWWLYGLSFSLIDLFLFLHVRQLSVGVYKSLKSLYSYSKAIAEINTRFPDATAEELRILDDVCSICRDTMEQAKRLPCGHFFHRQCLQSWIEHQTVCPSCRRSLVANAAPPANAQQQRQQQPQQPQQPRPIPGNLYPAQQAAFLEAHRQFQQRSGQQQQQQPQQQQQQGQAQQAPADGTPAASIHAVGLRNRFAGQGAAMNALSASGATLAQNASHSHGPGSSNIAHGHSHSHGVLAAAGATGFGGVGGAANVTTQIQPIFRVDTTGIRWLPSFSLEVQSVREELIMEPQHMSMQQQQQQQQYQPQQQQMNMDEVPPLEPVQTMLSNDEERKEAPVASNVTPSTATSDSSEEQKDVSAASSSSSSSSAPSLREKIYLATQQRLKTGTTTMSDDPTAASSMPSNELDSGSVLTLTPQVVVTSPSSVSSSSSSSSTVGASASSSSSLSPNSGEYDSTLTLPFLPPMTRSPLLGSQADADAVLAAQLQAEENQFAAEQERQRREGGSAFSRFFTSL